MTSGPIYAALVAAGALSALHALLWKRDPRSALGWIAVCLLFPGVGAALYWLLGVNRLRTRGQRLQVLWPVIAVHHGEAADDGVASADTASADAAPADAAPPDAGAGRDVRVPGGLQDLARLSDTVTRRPLLGGNQVTALHNGEEAYPAMLAAIAGARQSVLLCTYIFDMDETGRTFVEALAAASGRGVEVKVLIDGIGEKYSWPRASRVLRRRGLAVARFLPPSLLRPNLHMNLREHRKLLVVDGSTGFTGGMNIGDRHLVARTDNPRPVVDLHFRVEGPVVIQMEAAFLEDWAFATDSAPVVPPPRNVPAGGGALCRGVSDGPNEDFQRITWILLGAFAAARHRVVIMTPYFIPDRQLVAAINAAALRGVRVEILLPGRNNLPFVDWACRAMLWELLERGVRAFYRPAPFVHSKLLLVDDDYALVGSANLDPRSLRLNFEFALEVYDRALVAALSRHCDEARAASREIRQVELDGRPLWQRVRDGLAKLASPYL